MHDPGVRRNDFETGECLLRPAQQGVTLAVALEFEIGRSPGTRFGSKLIHDHRVIDDQLGGQQRVHALGIAAHLDHGVAHRGEIDDRRQRP